MINEVFRSWGFANSRDYFLTISGLKTTVFAPALIKVLATGLGLVLAFWGQWIWDPPGASFLIIGMDLVNAWYGYQVAVKIKGERFNRTKFHKTFSIIVSSMLAMAMLHIAIKYYPYWRLLADVLFAYLFGFKQTAIFNHWAQLKLQSGSLAAYMRGALKKVLQSWLMRVLQTPEGAQLVDSIQQHATPPTPAAPDELPAEPQP